MTGADETTNNAILEDLQPVLAPAEPRTTPDLVEDCAAKPANVGQPAAEVEERRSVSVAESRCDVTACTEPRQVYRWALEGLNMNEQNEDGDTALHIAVRARNMGLAGALLQCGCSPTICNRLGRSAADEANRDDDEMVAFLAEYSPGIRDAVWHSSLRGVMKLIHHWVSVHSVISADGLTALQLANKLKTNSPKAYQCWQALDQFASTSAIIHATLADNQILLHDAFVAAGHAYYNVNLAHGDKFGATPLAMALRYENLDAAKMLLDAGARLNHRVIDGEKSSTPLYFFTLTSSYNPALADLLDSLIVANPAVLTEKDGLGRTAFVRAISAQVPWDRVAKILDITEGRCLLDRDLSGKSGRDIAVLDKQQEIVYIIDAFILDRVGTNLLLKLSIGGFKLDCGLDVAALTNAVAERGTRPEQICLERWAEVGRKGLEALCAARDDNVAALRHLNYGAWRTPARGVTPLHLAITKEQFSATKFLCDARPELLAVRDHANRIPLHYAYAMSKERGEEFIRLLLPGGGDEAQDCWGRVPAQYRCLEEVEKSEMWRQCEEEVCGEEAQSPLHFDPAEVGMTEEEVRQLRTPERHVLNTQFAEVPPA